MPAAANACMCEQRWCSLAPAAPRSTRPPDARPCVQGLASPAVARLLSDAEDEEGEAAEEDGSEAISGSRLAAMESALDPGPMPATEPAAA